MTTPRSTADSRSGAMSQSFNTRLISPRAVKHDTFTRSKSDERTSEEKIKRAELGHAGIGCKLSEGSEGWPIVRVVTAQGSMEREGTIFPGAIITHVDDMDTKNMSLMDVSSAISGALGTMVSLVLKDHLGDSERRVVLTRATPQYWEVWDEMVRAQQALTMATQAAGSQKQETTSLHSEMTILREKLHDADGQASRLKRMYEEEVRRAYRAEIEAGTLRKEKEFLEAGVDQLSRNLAENAHMLRMAERVGRDMLARAVASEKARSNEEAMRKAAEAREGKLKEDMAEMASRNGKYHKQLSELEHRASTHEAELKAKEGVEGAIVKVFADMVAMRKQFADASSSKMEALAERERALAESADLAKKVKGLEGLLDAANEMVRSLKGEVGSRNGSTTREVGGGRQEPGEAQQHDTLQDGAEDFGAEAAAAVAAAVARACEAERKVAELGDTVKELRDEISEEYQQRIKDSREAAKAQEALRHELAEARYVIETTRRSSEEALRGAQAATRELEVKYAGVLKTSSSLMKQVEELRGDLERAVSHDKETELRSMQLRAEKDRDALSLKTSELQQVMSQLTASQAEADNLRKIVEELERRWTDVPPGPAFQPGVFVAVESEGAEERERMEEGRRAVVEARVLQEQLQGLRDGLSAAVEREHKLSEQIISADAAIRGMERDCASLQEQLTEVAEAYKSSCTLSEKVALAARCEAAEKQVMSLEAETRRCLEGEAMARAELEELVRKHDEVLRGALDESTRVRSEVRLRETRLLGNVSSLEEKVESLEAQLAFYQSLPVDVSVGLEVAELVSTEHGKMRRTYKVCGLTPGTTAALCQAFRVGDVIVAIDGILCEDMTMRNVLDRMTGKRGSVVELDFVREGLVVGKGGQQAVVRARVKRGGYGPEHAVVVLDARGEDARLSASGGRLAM